MEVYEGDGVVFLGIELGERRSSFSGNIKNPLDFVEKMNWSFSNGIDTNGNIWDAYAAELDIYMVIGKNGRIAYISPVVGFDEGAIDIPTLAANIRKALSGLPTPVRRTTWSRIKVMWQD